MLKVKEYKNNKEKLVDFCLGFFGIYAAILVLSNLAVFLPKAISQGVWLGLDWVALFIIHGGFFLLFLRKRKYVAIGIAAELLVAISIGLFFLQLKTNAHC